MSDMTYAIVQLVLSFALPGALALLAWKKKALTRGGLRAAYWLTFLITFCGGIMGFLCVALTFLLVLLPEKLKKKQGKSGDEAPNYESSLHAKPGGKRDAVQVLCNVGVGALALLLQSLTDTPALLYAFGGAMAASLADSMAGEFGMLSKAEPVDLLSRKPVERGLSGGVTGFGLGMSCVGAFIIALLCSVAPILGLSDENPAHLMASVTAAGIFAALCDSLLGSLLQAKYRCPVCGKLTENPRHCGAEGQLEHGLRWVTNDVVNLCNNLIGAAVALALAQI